MTKMVLALASGLVLITGIMTWGGGQQAVKPNSLRGAAVKAKAEGKNRINIRAPFGEYAGAESPPDEVLADATVVIAQPIDSYTYAPNEEDIVTYYKFKVEETLKEAPPCTRCPDRTPPDEILPVNEGEFLLGMYGGTMSVDGVQVSMFEPGFPPFSKNKKYLLFLRKSTNGTVSLLVGPSGAYGVSPEGAIEPINGRPHPLKEAIAQRFNGSVEQLKQHLKKPKS